MSASMVRCPALVLSNAPLTKITLLAYQSALLTGPLLLVRMLVSLLQFPQFLRTLFTFILVIPSLYMAYVQYLIYNLIF